MTIETVEPTKQVNGRLPSNEAPKFNITSCLLAGLGVFGLFALGSIAPWEALSMWFTNLAWKNPALMFGAALGSTIMFSCIASKPVEQLGKHGRSVEKLAVAMIAFCGFWMMASLTVWLGYLSSPPSEIRYAEIMHLAPEHIDIESRDEELVSSLKRRGQYDMWASQERCQAIVNMSGRDMKYSLSVNGQEFGACKNGLNIIEWRYKGD